MGLHEADDTRPVDESIADDGLRTAPRFNLMLRAGKLVGGSSEFLCILRDVSATGMRLKLFHPLPDHEEFEIELMDGERYRICPVWQEEGHAGFRFADSEIDVEALLASMNASGRRRQVRLHLGIGAIVVADGVAHGAHLENLSQHGARIGCEAFLALGQRLRLEGQGLPPRMATVSWRREGVYGLVLEETFRLEELAQLVATLHASRPQAPPTMQISA